MTAKVEDYAYIVEKTGEIDFKNLDKLEDKLKSTFKDITGN